MQDHHRAERRQKWARLRFSIVGPLLAAPPGRGELKDAFAGLSAKSWRHPETGDPVRFGRSTIERWYYTAKKAETDPVGSLTRRTRKDRGRSATMDEALTAALCEQHCEHPSWSYTLHAENLVALARERDELGAVPSVSTVRRWMKAEGLFRTKRRRARDTDGYEKSVRRFEEREVRSFEADFVHALWHLDFHVGSRRVLVSEGRFAKAVLLGVLDDRSRLCCHAQWYLSETAQALVHALVQAILKRGLPRGLMTDNGAAMKAAETQAGLSDLGVSWEPTLCYSPYQNGKQEVFWSSVEGRLMAMLEGEKELSLALLNEATQAWVERDYNQREHSEIGTTPKRRALDAPSVARESPSPDDLRRAFRQHVVRRQRRSDGTLLVEGRRFEVPSRFSHLERLSVRYARWDLARVDLWDPVERVVLARLLPQDKSKNAAGKRRPRERQPSEVVAPKTSGMAPLLRQMIDGNRSQGIAPSYVPQRDARDGEVKS
jgi:transposase InsO family protein